MQLLGNPKRNLVPTRKVLGLSLETDKKLLIRFIPMFTNALWYIYPVEPYLTLTKAYLNIKVSA